MDTTRRVHVDVEADWLQIQQRVGKAISSTLDVRLSSLPGGKDGSAAKSIRQELETRLGKIQEDMWEYTKPNLRVNGHDYERYVPATEPFDELLDRNLWGVQSERIMAQSTISGFRRTKPTQILDMRVKLENLKTEAAWYPDDEEIVVAGTGNGRSIEDIPKPPRYQETVDNFTAAAGNMAELAQNAQLHLSRAQRAKSVREEIAKLGS